MFLFKLICCFAGTLVFAAGVTGFENWLNSRPIVEEKEPPFYITKQLGEDR